ncbi:BspA family leucine-rich repeat surface protein [Winogradskyella flava]|uniref:BspA family leucine-rich repeat surface protein n=1 Tax=Winogradskyella flava TaxID=1884876 RepID=A0A842IWG9_9FLAO|nr:BspA family leucine-rich repeat surface protein [Winogradskyella flava]MBC2846053.1 BspA family leucine-rich repeat surface protein [Winogradskyella flava]
MKPLYTLQKLTILLILVTTSINAQILTEDFESGSFPPAGWVTFRGINDIGPNNDWETTADANTGSSAAFSRYSDPGIGIAEDWLVTPLLNLTNIDNATLSFFEKETEGPSWLSQYDIRVSTNTQTNHNDFVTVVTYNDLSLDYQENIIELGGYDGQQIYIAFVHTDEYQDNWLIDDVSVTGNATFTTTWQTTTANESITIPTDVNETYDYSVEWGDGNTTVEHTGNASHTYSIPGTYDVKITELFPRISFLGMPQEECDKIIDIKQWGDNPWTSMQAAFSDCSNLQISATDAPNLSNVTTMSGMFTNATSFNQPINHWDVSNVGSMFETFRGATSFNQPLDNWDVSNVTSMHSMFFDASSFNQPIDTWDTSNVVSMGNMFRNAIAFNQPLDTWDTSNVSSVFRMFQNTSSFNLPLNTWDMSSITNMNSMFQYATMFNQPLDNWDVGNVTNMTNMFNNTNLSIQNYDATLQGWAALPSLQNNVIFDANSTNYCNGEAARDILINTYNWTITDDGLDCSSSYFISTWQTTTANESITIPTVDTETYNYDIDWGDGTTTTNHTGNASHTYSTQGSYDVTITGLFPRIYFLGIPEEESDKIIDIKQWGDNPWTSMQFAFARCSNLQISATDAPNLSNATSMGNMFFEASSFNQSINHWDVSNIISMREVFARATSFNQPLDTWDVSNVIDMSSLFFEASSFNQPLNSWDVSNVTNMNQLFRDATSFNQPLDAWDTSNVTLMVSMFTLASSFNQPLDTWNTSNVTNMRTMFAIASSFNQPIGTWDTSNVTQMEFMFRNATSFNQPLDTWNVGNVIDMDNMLNNSNLSVENYDQTLQAWATLPSLQANVPLGASGINYCNGEAARDSLINTYGWTITDGGLDCSTLSIGDDVLPNISLYPNPTTDYIRVKNLNTQDNYAIYNILGKRVDAGQLLTDSKISIAQLEKGIYFLKLENYKTLRFIKH